MSDAAPKEELTGQPSEQPPKKPGFLADPVARVMVYAALALVILFLATVVGVLATGVAERTGPRSVTERELIVASVQAGKTGAASAPYINALVAAGDLQAARVALAQARASVTATEPVAALDLAEARLLSARKEYDKAAGLADKAMKGYVAQHAARVAKGGKIAAAAKSAGYGDDYYNSALLKAQALVQLGRWKEAVEAYDVFMRVNPTAADILIDRGNAKAELNDKAGAEKDFREALRFVPYDEDAKAGLKKIGAAQ